MTMGGSGHQHHGSHGSHGNHGNHRHHGPTKNATIAALTSTALISLAPNLLLLAFPQYARGEGRHSQLLVLGQAMAAGGLLGDVFLHTLPHAGGDHAVGLWVLAGFTLFLVADMALRTLGHSHDHDHGTDSSSKDSDHSHSKDRSASASASASASSGSTSTVMLNLTADALHNFTDGLAIGASFAANKDMDASVWTLMQSRGGLATISILCHEIPHELGDFAILVQHGFSNRQAIMAQFGTAVAALLGTVVGLVLQEWFVGDSLMWLTAGGFVYLAACTIIPELLEAPATFQFRLAQLACFGMGIACLYAVSWLEELDPNGHHGHSHGEHDHHDDPPPPHHDHHDHHGHDHSEL